MRVTPQKCVPLANACHPIYTGSKRTSGRNHHVRPPSPVWRKRYINLNLWGPCLKWSLKSRSPQHDSEWQQSQRICGSLSKYIGLSSYRIYAIPSILSSRSPHKRALLSTSDILRLDAFYALPRLIMVNYLLSVNITFYFYSFSNREWFFGILLTCFDFFFFL